MSDVLHKLQIAIPGAASGLISNFAPDPSLPGLAGYVPGATAAENLIALGGQGYDAVANLVNKGTGTNLPMAPEFFRTAGEHAGATEQQIYEQLGGAPSETYADELIRSGSSLAGGFLIPGLGPAKLAKAGTAGAVLGAGGHAAMDAVAPAQPEQAFPAGVFGGGTEPTTPKAAAASSTHSFPAGTFDTGDANSFPAGVFTGGDATAPADGWHVPAYSEAGQSDVTVWQSLLTLGLAVVGVAGGKRLAGHGARVGTVEREIRAADPAYLEKANDYKNSIIAQQGDQIGGNSVEPPLPSGNALRQAAIKLQEQGLEAGSNLMEFSRLTSPNPRASEKILTQIGAYIDEQQRDVRFGEFSQTGHEPVSGISIPSPMRWSFDVERLDKARFDDFNYLLAAENEVDKRNVMANNRSRKGQPPDPVADRYDFYDQDRTALDNIIRKGRADPVIAELADRTHQIHAGLTDIAEHHGLLTTADATRMKSQFANYLPEGDKAGLFRKNYGKDFSFPSRGGLPEVNTKATSLWAQHIEQLHHDIETNNFHRAMKDHIMEYQKNTPNAIEYLTKIDRPPEPDRIRHITVKTSGGTEYYKVNSSSLYTGLSGENLNRARIHYDSMSKAKQMFQGLTTGVGSLASGRIVPLRNLLFTAFQAPINATGGVYGGPVSALTRGKLPKTLTAPLDIPLNVIGALGTWGNNTFGKRMSLWGSDVFRPDNQNHLTQVIRSLVGDAPLKAASEAMYDHYMRSDYHLARTSGVGGQSLQQRIKAPTLMQDVANQKTIRLQMAHLNPSIVVGMDAGPTARPYMLRLKNAVQKEFIEASEATHQFLFSLNKNNPAFHGDMQQVAHAVRGIVGDPSVSGSSKLAQGARTWLPYANVTMQGTRALTRAIATNPADTIGAMVTGFGSLIALGMATAFQSGDNLDHFVNETSAEDRAKFLHIYNGPGGAKDLIKIPWPAEMSWFTPLMSEMMFHLFNVAGAPHDPEIRSDISGFLKDFLWHHLDKTTVEGQKHGLNDAFNFIDIPPVVKLGVAMAGGHARVDVAKLWNDASTGNLGLNSIVSSGLPTQPLPNQSGADSAAHGANGKKWIEMASSMFGLGSNLVAHAFGLDTYMRQGNSFLDSLGHTGADWLQDVKDLNPMANTLLWENEVRLSKVPPVVDETRRALREMQKTSGARTAERFEGTTGGRNPLRVPTYSTDQGKLPDDPQLKTMYQAVASHLGYLNKTTLPQIGQLEKQLVEMNARMQNTQERRVAENKQQRIIADKYRIVADEVRRLNDALSATAGVAVDIRKGINWQGDMSQFRQ